jgi:PEP-CTERM motif
MRPPSRLHRFLARSSRLLALLGLAFGVTLGGLPDASRSVPITGSLSGTGSLAIGAGTLTFLPPGPGPVNFGIVSPLTGAFVPLLGTGAVLANLDAITSGVGVPLSLANFLTFAAAPTYSGTLTSIANGVFSSAACGAAPAAGQTCTPLAAAPSYLPAFDLVNTAFGSTLSFGLSGTLVDSSDASVSNFSGVVTAQFAGLSYQQVLAALVGGGTVTAAYSANFLAVVPEPATSALVGVAAVGLALAARRRTPG